MLTNEARKKAWLEIAKILYYAKVYIGICDAIHIFIRRKSKLKNVPQFIVKNHYEYLFTEIRMIRFNSKSTSTPYHLTYFIPFSKENKNARMMLCTLLSQTKIEDFEGENKYYYQI